MNLSRVAQSGSTGVSAKAKQPSRTPRHAEWVHLKNGGWLESGGSPPPRFRREDASRRNLSHGRRMARAKLRVRSTEAALSSV